MKTITDFYKKKQLKEKFSVITCYDYTSATIVANTEIDCILVGDSGSMTMHGYPDTTSATMETMVSFTQAVAKGARNQLIIADLPFMSYRKSLSDTIENVTRLVQAGGQAVKLEGANNDNLNTIQYIVDSGVPVVGHIGLTPQHFHALGGFKVQGKTQAAHNKLLEEAQLLAKAGCCALVLECIPSGLAKEITNNIPIATIGIGAGSETDGQVLIFQDLLGLQTDFKPKFVKQYLNGAELLRDGINQYAQEVKSKQFPTEQHTYRG